MEIKCLKCASETCVRNGRVFGWQRYKCKACGYQFTKMAPAGKPLFIKLICHSLYVSGLSMREIAVIVGVTAQSVSRWIKKWHTAYMTEIGEHEILYNASRETLLDCLNLAENEDILVSSRLLPSGAKFNIVVQLPRRESFKNHEK